MASEDDASSNLDSRLYEAADDEEDIQWKAPLAALLDGSQTPSQVAQAYDSLIRAETSNRLQKLNSFAASHQMTAEARESDEWLNLYPPNASALTQEVIRLWCRVCTAFHPHSESQDRLVSVLRELRDLPRWMAPETRPDENGNVVETEFWTFRGNWIGLADEFRRQIDDIGPYTHIPESCIRWKNLQSAMARATALGLIYGAPFTGLQKLASSSDQSGKAYDFHIAGAAQWVIWPVECRYVYVECLKKESIEHYWEPWSKQRWTLWKAVFRAAGEDNTYDDRTRSLAQQALLQMQNTEKEVDEEGSEGSNSESD